MPESLSAFSPVVAGQIRLYIKMQALSPLYLSDSGYNCAVTGPYNSQRKPKAECAMENYMKKYFTSMPVFLPHVLQGSAYALKMWGFGF